MGTILIVDDEANIRELVNVYLASAGFTVLEAADGPAALATLRDADPDVVILDLMLPGMDGAEVCRKMRCVSQVPIIILTARDTDVDKVALLDAGADDYVTKPFSPPELVARVRAVLRRGGKATCPEEALTLGGLILDPATREVVLDGEPVNFTAKEFDLLAVMLAEPGIVFSRSRLLERVWGLADYMDERGVDVHIRHLREKLGDDASTPRFIETVRGVGYRVHRDGG